MPFEASVQLEAHRACVSRSLHRMFGSAFDAEDAVAGHDGPRLAQPQSLRWACIDARWLYRIATNVCAWMPCPTAGVVLVQWKRARWARWTVPLEDRHTPHCMSRLQMRAPSRPTRIRSS